MAVDSLYTWLFALLYLLVPIGVWYVIWAYLHYRRPLRDLRQVKQDPSVAVPATKQSIVEQTTSCVLPPVAVQATVQPPHKPPRIADPMRSSR